MLKGRAGLIPLLSATLLVVGVSSCKKNHPPDAPAVPTGPEYCFKDTRCTFRATATDPDDDSVAVRFDWGDSTMSEWSRWFAGGDTVTLPHVWADTGTYEVITQTRDQKLVISPWSGALTVRVALRRPPHTPDTPTGPDIGGRDSSYTFAAVAFHPDSIAVAIRFAWGYGDTSDWSPFVASGESVRMSHAWSTADTHSVTAQARDTGNAMSLWSSPHDIIIRLPDTLLQWRVRLADYWGIEMLSSPALGPDGTIYVGSCDSSLYAVRPDGVISWRFPTGGNVTASPALASDGTVYVGSYDNYVYAVNPGGTLKWRYLTEGVVNSSPGIAADGTIYAASSDSHCYALNPDGTLKWSYLIVGRITSSPAIGADGTVYFGSSQGFLYAVSPDGGLKWRYEAFDFISEASPAIGSDGTIYCGTYGDRYSRNLYALNPDGTLGWSFSATGSVIASPAIAADGTIYVTSAGDVWGPGRCYALNPDGTERWSLEVSMDVNTSPAISSDGTIYFCAETRCYAEHPDGTAKWRYWTDGLIRSSPTIGSDGSIYFACGDGYLYALKGTSPLADSPWPKFHHDLKNTGRAGGRR